MLSAVRTSSYRCTWEVPLLTHKMFRKTMRKMSNEFYQGELTRIILGVIFEDIESKLEKSWPNLSKFQSISILAIGSYRRQETVSVP